MTARAVPWVVLLVVAAFFAPLLFRGAVIYPHDEALQLGVAETPGSEEPWNLRFSDESAFFVPELHAHLHGPRSGWLATWTNAVQLGRPLTHLSGLSRVWLPTHLLALVVADARVLYTLSIVLTVAAAGLFAALFFLSIGLRPWTAAAVAIASATSIPVLYWTPFVMCIAGFTWTWCLLWLVTRQIESPSPARLLGIAAAVYALLMTAYPQHVVWHGAFVAAWSLHRLVLRPAPFPRRVRVAGALAVAAVLGAALAAPVYLDVALAAARSTRPDMDVQHFVEGLPRIGDAREALRELVVLFDPALLGAPAAGGYPAQFHGIGLGPLFAVAIALSWTGRGWRELYLEYAFCALCLVMTLVPGLYAFAVEHLGLGFSRTLPLWGAIVPGTIVAARTLERLQSGRVRGAPLLAVAGGALIVGIGWAATGFRREPAELARWIPIVLAGAVLVTALFHARGWVLAALASAVAFVEGPALVLDRPLASIHRSSALVDAIRARTPGGERYALVGAEPPDVLAPNVEIPQGLASVHSYDPLSPRAYLDWIERVSTRGPRVAGRKFLRITDATRLASGELEDAGVGLVLSTRAIAAPNLVEDGRAGPFAAYRTLAAPSSVRRVPSAVATDASGRAVARARRADDLGGARIVEDLGDRVRIELAPRDEETLVWLARQEHPQWRVTGGASVLVNGIWQGVRAPPGSRELVLEFRPWARWAWIAWPVLGLAALAIALYARGRSGGTP